MHYVHPLNEVCGALVLTGECDFSDNTVGSVLLGVDPVLFSTLDDAIPSASAKIWDDSAVCSQQSRKSPACVKTFSHVSELLRIRLEEQTSASLYLFVHNASN